MGAPAAKIEVEEVTNAGTVYATVGSCETCARVQTELLQSGWTNSSLDVHYTDAGDTRLLMLEKRLKIGDSGFEVPQTGAGWYGVTLVFP
eukprot:SAG31_NODE_1270_length_9065_cov_7.007473_3_plen_90_part_00